VDDTLSAALAFDRAVRVRAAQRTIALEHGVVVRHDDLPRLHHLNAVLLDAPLAASLDAEAVATLVEEQLAPLAHRHVAIDDAAAAERIAPELNEAGWSHGRVVYMSLRAPAMPARSDHPARELMPGESQTLQLEMVYEDAPGGGAVARALARELVAGQRAVRAASSSRCFGAFDGDRAVSSCTLFIEHDRGGLAMIDEVGTLRAHRERGYARAVIVAAMQAAIDHGCDPIIVPADADDWPQLIYAKLGFEPLGMQVWFTR
jgi:GNAT superfamily N-acetyltransferase